MEEYVLVVDDQPDVRRLITDVIEMLGFAAQEAKNGVEALKHTEEKIPRLIVMDLMMPDMDGFTALARLRANPNTRNVPVILLSALGGGHGPRMHTLHGVVDVLIKGEFTMEQLCASLEKVLFTDNNTLPV